MLSSAIAPVKALVCTLVWSVHFARLADAAEVSGSRSATDLLEPAGDPIDDEPAIVF